MINIKIQKKDLWLLAAIMVFLVGVAYVIAYGGTQPSIMGHSFNEIELPSCSDGQILKKVSGNWQCASDNSGGTDTRCDTSGTCSQVCIGTNCRSSWPASALCTWSGVTYSTGARCCVRGANTEYVCQSTGAWAPAGVCLGTNDCGT